MSCPHGEFHEEDCDECIERERLYNLGVANGKKQAPSIDALIAERDAIVAKKDRVIARFRRVYKELNSAYDDVAQDAINLEDTIAALIDEIDNITAHFDCPDEQQHENRIVYLDDLNKILNKYRSKK